VPAISYLSGTRHLAEQELGTGELDEGKIVLDPLLPTDQQAPRAIEPAMRPLDGLITNDKFCLTRRTRLRLRWRSQGAATATARENAAEASRWTAVLKANRKWEDRTHDAIDSLQAIPYQRVEGEQREYGLTLTHQPGTTKGGGSDGYPDYYSRLEDKTQYRY